MKILLTGGTGFFGKSLLRHWLAKQRTGLSIPDVCVLSRCPQKFLGAYPEFANLSWLSFIKGDILDASSLLQKKRFTHVIHAAADSTFGPRLTPLEQYDQIVEGTRNVLDCAKDSGASRFLFASSGAVYGRQPGQLDRMPEDWLGIPDPLNPAMAYGVAKRAAEHLCTLYKHAYGLDTIVARCFAFVGPDLPLDAHFAIGNFIHDALKREAIIISGDGTALRSYLYQEDLAQWLVTLLLYGQAGQAYNVGSDQAVSIAELALLVRDELAPSKPVRILGQADEQVERNRYVPATDKARSLGLTTSVPLQEAIRRSVKLGVNYGH
jgi:dTDP-glucose 4,6-dehydratase